MSETDKDLQKAVDEHLKRLYEQYKANQKVFTATHFGHLSLAVVFVLSVLIPFFFLQIDARDTSAEMQRLARSIEQQERHLAVYRQAMGGLKAVFEAVENTPMPLEGYIRSLEAEAAGGPPAALPGGLKPAPESCGPSAERDTWMECRIRQYMAARAAQWQAILADEIAAPLETLGIRDFDQWKADLKAGMKRYADRARAEMAANPRFWREFNRDAPIYRNMVDGVHRFWADHRFEEIGRRMEEAAAGWRADVEKHNLRKAEIQKSKEGLNNALKNIKTRFGKLGLELDDAILLAPVAFAALFLLAASNLCRNIRLRQSFHRLFQSRDPRKTTITDEEIELAMPLWLDPLAPAAQRTIKFAGLLTPAFVAALTLAVVLYCWTIPEAFPGLTGLDRLKYILYYLVAAGIFVAGLTKIRSAINSYGDPPAATASPTP